MAAMMVSRPAVYQILVAVLLAVGLFGSGAKAAAAGRQVSTTQILATIDEVTN